MNFLNKADLITGASSGIGQATAIELAGKNARVMPVARREARLEALKADIAAKGGEAELCVTDVTDPIQVKTAAERTKSVRIIWSRFDKNLWQAIQCLPSA